MNREEPYKVEQCGLVVLDPFRKQRRACLMDPDAMALLPE
jgi:hypothetical protein